jgi:hypothetical protein
LCLEIRSNVTGEQTVEDSFLFVDLGFNQQEEASTGKFLLCKKD